jgi:type II secretory pathway predicted ATPase ExeA
VFFGFKKDPFSQEIRVEDMMKSSSLMGVKERFLYAVNLGAIAVITGDVGSGKSSALRFASATLHPSEYRVLYVTATSGTIIELYKQICYALNMEVRGGSKAVLSRMIKSCVMELVDKKERPVLIIDEDSKAVLPIVIAGQNNLMDSLMFRQSRPLASRVVARGHMESLNGEDMVAYLQHHQNVAGCKRNLFSEQSVTAIHQGSGGLLRRANNLARGALVAAAAEKCAVVSAEHVRIASTEII